MRAESLTLALRLSGLEVVETIPDATDATRLVERIHDSERLEVIKRTCAKANSRTYSRPLTPSFLPANGDHGATRVSKASLDTALRAVALVASAVDWIVDESDAPSVLNKRAFCVVRPPGHHAGVNELDPIVGGCGFCLLNNAAAAAVRAKAALGEGSRVAIVDFDVHHGNGTEEILLKRLGKGYAYYSTHLYESFPGQSELDYFPGTGATTLAEPADGPWIGNVALEPMWCERSGPSREQDAKRVKLVDNSDADSPAPSEKKPLSGRAGFREAFIQTILPSLARFRPSLVVISAGFDGALGDEGNLCPSAQKPGLDLTPEDFEWVTREIVRVCPSRVASVLEGGYGRFDEASDAYDLSNLVACVQSHVRGLG